MAVQVFDEDFVLRPFQSAAILHSRTQMFCQLFLRQAAFFSLLPDALESILYRKKETSQELFPADSDRNKLFSLHPGDTSLVLGTPVHPRMN